VTFCNPRGHDAGEFVRSVFNSFAFDSTPESVNLKKTFWGQQLQKFEKTFINF
jgi:hypothetical protein